MITLVKTMRSRGGRPSHHFVFFLVVYVIVTLSLFCHGCSLQKIAVNRLGDALAQGGSTFSSDNDPELVKAAAPFSLKLMQAGPYVTLAESVSLPNQDITEFRRSLEQALLWERLSLAFWEGSR